MKRWVFGTMAGLHLSAENRLSVDAPPVSQYVISRLCDGVWQRYEMADHSGVEGDPGPTRWGLPICAECRRLAVQRAPAEPGETSAR